MTAVRAGVRNTVSELRDVLRLAVATTSTTTTAAKQRQPATAVMVRRLVTALTTLSTQLHEATAVQTNTTTSTTKSSSSSSDGHQSHQRQRTQAATAARKRVVPALSQQAVGVVQAAVEVLACVALVAPLRRSGGPPFKARVKPATPPSPPPSSTGPVARATVAASGGVRGCTHVKVLPSRSEVGAGVVTLMRRPLVKSLKVQQPVSLLASCTSLQSM